MKTINLTKNKVALVDDEDYDLLIKYKWNCSDSGSNIYASSYIKEVGVYMHRVIMNLNPGDGLDIDHINGNTLDNRKSNLRICSRSQNMANSNKNIPTKSSIYKGVCLKKTTGRWKATIKCNYKAIHLGYYKKEEDAAKAYNEASIKYFGKFAKPNIIKKIFK